MRRILIVDDDASLRIPLQQLLVGAGDEVDEAGGAVSRKNGAPAIMQDLGAEEVFAKPFDRDQLPQAVGAVLNRVWAHV